MICLCCFVFVLLTWLVGLGLGFSSRGVGRICTFAFRNVFLSCFWLGVLHVEFVDFLLLCFGFDLYFWFVGFKPIWTFWILVDFFPG